jgi:hypothetical protein
LKNYLWRLKQKIGQHGRLNPQSVTTSLEQVFFRKLERVTDHLGCKPAETVRLIIQDWLSYAREGLDEDTTSLEKEVAQMSARLEMLTRAVESLTAQTTSAHNVSPTPNQAGAEIIASSTPPQEAPHLSISPEILETISERLVKLENVSEALIKGMADHSEMLTGMNYQITHLHRLQPALMGISWSTLKLILDIVAAKDPRVINLGPDLKKNLINLRNIYSLSGFNLSLAVQDDMQMPKKYYASPSFTFKLYEIADKKLEDLLARGE